VDLDSDALERLLVFIFTLQRLRCFLFISAQAQIALGNEIDAKLRAIEKCNLQLQNAVSVASYAISLEQLENVLNASNMLESLSIRS